MGKRNGRYPLVAALPLLFLLLTAAPLRSAAQGLLLGDRLGATPSLGRLLDRAGAGTSNTAATNPAGAGAVSAGAAGGGITGPVAAGAGGAAGSRALAPAPSGSTEASTIRTASPGSSPGSVQQSPTWESPSPAGYNQSPGYESPSGEITRAGVPPSPAAEVLVPSPPPYLPSFTPVQAAGPPSPAVATAAASPPQSWGAAASPPWGVVSAQAAPPADSSATAPPSPLQAAESYPRCGADACSAPQPAAFEGSDKFGNLTFTLQLSANSGLVPFGQAQSWAVGNATLALLLPVIGNKAAAIASVEPLATDQSGSGVQSVRAKVEVNSTRLHLSTMLAVLQQTSQNREFLNRLRAFGLGSLIDAYLTNIASSERARVGGTDGSTAQAPSPIALAPSTLAPASQLPAQDLSTAAAQQAAQAPASGLPTRQAVAAPAQTRLVPARVSGAIDLAPAAAPPAESNQIVPGVAPAAAQPSWGEPMPNQTPSPGVTMTMALVGPNSAALTPADRSAIQVAMAQAIPGITPDQVIVGPAPQPTNAAGTRNLLQAPTSPSVYTIQGSV
ncbi:hypothetical protein COCSUDRAFT_68421 [Coccomyxa subellipsoidea C-169]|uniref:Uncharacterized protein n=1 Tax=Coccomyxa subellipsoidea (strain C-169) TaxID=574566 RepID=I0YI90_COCSC|nr:hypothetical protein COCSUDRAFT_68421 [Coccomyxa subellipsoidea C-169]EIE18109.1 hypothetical protein COCSUDRAFT_68421 [Coccomyxa subellipsoidea C-169]|eukprot:XP_005642653.1 hypothetical protein COCSUDRAFT_68421 [Coccomyxa subellipsoidea C-169]